VHHWDGLMRVTRPRTNGEDDWQRELGARAAPLTVTVDPQNGPRWRVTWAAWAERLFRIAVTLATLALVVSWAAHGRLPRTLGLVAAVLVIADGVRSLRRRYIKERVGKSAGARSVAQGGRVRSDLRDRLRLRP